MLKRYCRYYTCTDVAQLEHLRILQIIYVVSLMCILYLLLHHHCCHIDISIACSQAFPYVAHHYASTEQCFHLSIVIDTIATQYYTICTVYTACMQDPGPVYDIVLWRDSSGWAVVVDTSETGDMTAVIPMREYPVAQEYRTFSALDSLNYGVQVYDEGVYCVLFTVSAFQLLHQKYVTMLRGSIAEYNTYHLHACELAGIVYTPHFNCMTAAVKPKLRAY
jgi:hypothetical protein